MTTENNHEGTDIWEDFNSGYVPSEELDIHPSLSLYESYDSDLDPVSYEVIRHSLWTINEEHGRTLENVSGSPSAYFGQDFNPTILTADGEVIFNGPYVQLFSPVAELQVKWILENRSDNPGIEPGDIFLSNDPWVASTHQSDVFFMMPVFHEDELFCWVTNTLHQYDVGGRNAGSFVPGADDVYDEPTPIPPIKIAANDEVREDQRQMYLRHSRLPNLVGLDFNAQVAGVRFARERVKGLIDEYGPQVVKGSMRKIIEDSEEKFLEKLREIPDGTWRTRSYEEGAKIGDDQFYPAELQLKKEGDTLTFRNTGTADNVGAINITYAGFRTAISCAINPMMLYDQLWVTSGAYRHIEIETEPGTINRAEYPSGVSCGGTLSVEFTISLIQDVVTRMLSASDASRGDIITDPTPGLVVLSQAGIDQWGNQFGTMNMDNLGTGFGARSDRSGIDVGGITYAPKGPIPNVEQNEQDYPMLYLYREEAKDGGGPGEHRGGTGMQTAWLPHKTEQIDTVIAGTGCITPNTRGLSSYPGATIRSRMRRDTDIESQFDDQHIPVEFNEVEGSRETFPSKLELSQGPDDVMETRAPGTAGYGDPIERDPEAVLEDVSQNLVSQQVAYDIYGVALERSNGELELNKERTEKRRMAIVDERLESGAIPAHQED
jgi:N-methylhydantoinase B